MCIFNFRSCWQAYCQPSLWLHPCQCQPLAIASDNQHQQPQDMGLALVQGPRLQDPATISPAIGATRINQSSSLDLPTPPECLVSKLAPSLWLSRHLPINSLSCYFLSGIIKVLLYVRLRFQSCLTMPHLPTNTCSLQSSSVCLLM